MVGAVPLPFAAPVAELKASSAAQCRRLGILAAAGGGSKRSKQQRGPPPRQGKKKSNRVAVEEPPVKNRRGPGFEILNSETVAPSPPAGFVLNDAGEVVLVAPAAQRVVTIDDPETGKSLDCLIRRAFTSSEGLKCLLLTPLDTPLQFLKFVDEKGSLREISDEELEQILPAAEYALAKKRLHFVYSGWCLTARGCFCFTEDDVMDLETDYGNESTNPTSLGVEITTFQAGNGEFLIYTPFDPILFVAWKDETTGELTVADEDLMEDPAVIDAVDEERDFQDFVEEEEVMNEALALNKAS